MVDYTRATGSAGQLIIRDVGGQVEFWLSCSDPATWASGESWSGTVNGQSVGGTFSWSSGGGSKKIGGPWNVAQTQDVTFAIGDTGTMGLGGPTSFTQNIHRGKPGAASGLTATRVSTTQVNVAWTNGAAYTGGIRVYRRKGEAAWVHIASLSGSATSWSDTSITQDERFTYAVQGVVGAVAADWSNQGTIFTVPAAPTNVTAERSGGGITVSAGTVPYWPSQLGAFNIRDNGSDVATGVQLPWTHASPSPAVTHSYTVRGVVDGVNGNWSAPSNVVQLIAKPNPPVNLAPNGAVRATGTVRLSWKHNPVDSSPQTAYELRHKVGAGAWTTLSGTTAQFRDVTLPVGAVSWEVRTKGEHPDWSDWSATATVDSINAPGVNITTPGDEWESSTLTAEWTWFQAQARPQSAWEIELLDASLVLRERRTGSGSATSAPLATRLTEGAWTLRVRAATGDVWSAWAVQPFEVVFDPPALPLLDGQWDDSQGGVNLALTTRDPAEPVEEVTNTFTQPSFEVAGATVEVRRNVFVNPLAIGTAGFSVASGQGTVEAIPGGGVRFTASSASWFEMRIDASGIPVSTAGRVHIRVRASGTFNATARLRASASVPATLTPEWQEIDTVLTAGTGLGVQSGFSLAPSSGHTAGAWVEVEAVLFATLPDIGAFWAPGLNTDPDIITRFVGAVNNSESVMEIVPIPGLPGNTVQSDVWAVEGDKSLRVLGSVGDETTFGDLLTPFGTTPISGVTTSVVNDSNIPSWVTTGRLWNDPTAFSWPAGQPVEATPGGALVHGCKVSTSGGENPASLYGSFTINRPRFALMMTAWGECDVTIMVNRQPVTVDPIIVPDIGYQIVVVEGLGAGTHQVDFVIGWGANFLQLIFEDVVAGQPAQVNPGAVPEFRLGLTGDSYTDSGIPPYYAGLALELWKRTGWTIYQLGQGSTGYTNNGHSSGLLTKSVYGSTNRIAAMASANLDAVLVVGSVNDGSTAPATLTAAATAMYQKIAEKVNVPVLVAGVEPLSLPGQGPYDWDLRNTAIKTAAEAAPNVVGFIDWRAEDWLTGTGCVSAPQGDGNQDIYIGDAAGTDTIHANYAGNGYLAGRFVEAMSDLPAELPPSQWAQLATLTNQTVVVKARKAGQRVRLGGQEFAPTNGEVRVSGTGALELSSGWWDLLTIVSGLDYAGPAFSGDTRNASWAGTPGASTSTLSPLPTATRVVVERSNDGGQTWEQVTETATDTSLTDWESLSYGDILYRATAYTIEGATSVVEITVEARSDALWLSGGPGFTATARLPYSPDVQVSAGRARTLKQYAGRPLPVAYVGEAVNRTVAASGLTIDLDSWDTATAEHLQTLAQIETPVFLYRSPEGDRIFGVIDGISLQRRHAMWEQNGWGSTWVYGFTLTETERSGA